MSVADFGVLQGWMDKDLPLRVVLQAVEQIKSRQTSNHGGWRTMRYIKPAVEEEYGRWRKALA